MDCSPPDSSVPGILQARIVKWVAISFSRESFQPRDQTQVSYVSCIVRQVLYLLRHQGAIFEPTQLLLPSFFLVETVHKDVKQSPPNSLKS